MSNRDPIEISEKILAIFGKPKKCRRKNTFSEKFYFSKSNIIKVTPLTISARNSTLRGCCHGFNEKTLDFPRFWSKVDFFRARLQVRLPDRNPRSTAAEAV